MNSFRICACVALILGACLLTALAQAQQTVQGRGQNPVGGLAVMPTVIEVPPGRSAAAMEVGNRSTLPVAVQLSAFRWTQPGGEDRLEDDPAVTVSPAIATIPPGGVQTFRILLPRGARPAEATWRLILDELPRPAVKGKLDVRLRLSMPVFAAADHDGGADVQWRDESGQLIATNHGTRRLRFSSLLLDGRHSLPLAPSPYLLAGAERRWTLAAEPRSSLSSNPLRLTGASDIGPIDAPLRTLAAQ